MQLPIVGVQSQNMTIDEQEKGGIIFTSNQAKGKGENDAHGDWVHSRFVTSRIKVAPDLTGLVSYLMVNLSRLLLRQFRKLKPHADVLDLKAHFLLADMYLKY